MRFYQTLSAGIKPILTNTDMIFPFEDEIEWHSIVIIGENENDVINKVLDWWKNRNIEEIQIKCKKMYFNKIFSNIKINVEYS